MDYYKSGTQVRPHMQPEEASDIGCFDRSLTELQPKDTSVDQRKHENHFMGCSSISSSGV
jgi:hypothetical protein